MRELQAGLDVIQRDGNRTACTEEWGMKRVLRYWRGSIRMQSVRRWLCLLADAFWVSRTNTTIALSWLIPLLSLQPYEREDVAFLLPSGISGLIKLNSHLISWGEKRKVGGRRWRGERDGVTGVEEGRNAMEIKVVVCCAEAFKTRDHQRRETAAAVFMANDFLTVFSPSLPLTDIWLTFVAVQYIKEITFSRVPSASTLHRQLLRFYTSGHYCWALSNTGYCIWSERGAKENVKFPHPSKMVDLNAVKWMPCVWTVTRLRALLHCSHHIFIDHINQKKMQPKYRNDSMSSEHTRQICPNRAFNENLISEVLHVWRVND